MNRQFIVRTDASKKAFGNMLSQKNDKGDEIILAVESKQFTDQQIIWSIGMKELFAAAHAVRKYTNLIEGRKFLLITDCRSVFYLLKNRKEINLSASNPLTRNFLFLMMYEFDIKWSKGTGQIGSNHREKIQGTVTEHKTPERQSFRYRQKNRIRANKKRIACSKRDQHGSSKKFRNRGYH